MDSVKDMLEKLVYFVQSLSDLWEVDKHGSPFISYHRKAIMFHGNITPHIMRAWCIIAAESGIPFKRGDIIDHHNDMYLAWKPRFGDIYITATYTSFITDYKLKLTWSITEVKDGESYEI